MIVARRTRGRALPRIYCNGTVRLRGHSKGYYGRVTPQQSVNAHPEETNRDERIVLDVIFGGD